MDKYVKMFVTAADETQGDRLVSCSNITSILQASATTVTISYNNAAAASDLLTITHDAIAVNATTMRDWVMAEIENALRTSWQQPYYSADTTLPGTAADPTIPCTITIIALS